MIREAYKVDYRSVAGIAPEIIKVEITDPDGVSWRVAKRELRKWFIDQAASLRKVSLKEYFS